MTRSAWSHTLPWSTLRAGGGERITADRRTLDRVARLLDLEALDSLSAEFAFRPWLDGVEIGVRVRAEATQRCGVTLEPLPETVDERLTVRAVPEGSANAPREQAEVEVALDADDPPDVGPSEGIDVGAYALEALGLGLDPFPRKADALFEAPAFTGTLSPFAVLKSLAGEPNPD